ncbi:MAG: HD domain-containing protein, partial [candidate division NC10 bacterium]|nr:HD domain-containing protein [candidate division NC10 bacterium]
MTLAFARMGSLLADTAADAKATDRPDALYQRVRQEVARILEAAGAGKPFEVGPLQGVALGLVQAMAAGDGLLVQALAGGETHLDLSSHMVNVAIFAVKIGQGIGYGEEDLRRLALAGCLHDVGMVTIPRRILEKPGPLSPEELALVRQHPEKGAHILQALGSEFDWLATVA